VHCTPPDRPEIIKGGEGGEGKGWERKGRVGEEGGWRDGKGNGRKGAMG